MSPSAEARPQEEEDDGSWVNAELLAEILDEDAEVLCVDAQRATGKGDNYLSVLYRTRLEYRKAKSEEVRVKNLIVKGLPTGELVLNYVTEVGVFDREISMYNDMLPHLYAFADDKLGEGSFKKFSPTFYMTSQPNVLILDDLKTEGFVMASRRDRLDLAHCKLVVQNLARLHALSIAYDEKNPGSIAQYPERMFSETNRERLNQFMPQQLQAVIAEVSKWETSSNIINKLKALSETYIDRIMDVCNARKCCRTVLVHGDSWVNNILFKYSETGQPIDLRFVDFQLSRESSPGLDLNYFLSTSPRTDVRMCHSDNLLQEYCDEFERCATNLGYSGAPFTFQEIRKEVDRTALYGFMAATSILPAILAHPEDVVDVGSVTEEMVESGEVDFYEKPLSNTKFREALESMLPYFEECGVLD